MDTIYICLAIAFLELVHSMTDNDNKTIPMVSPEPDKPEMFKFGYNVTDREHLDPWRDVIYIMSPSNFLPHSGYVTSWHIYSAGPANITFQIWRPIDNHGHYKSFHLVGTNKVSTPKSTQKLDFKILESERIPFQEGDLIGLYFPGFNPIPYTKGADHCDGRMLYIKEPSEQMGCEPYYFREQESGWNPCRMYSLYATIVNQSIPENTTNYSCEHTLLIEKAATMAPLSTHTPSIPTEPAVMDLELIGGRRKNEGLVLVRAPDTPYGTICDDGWDDADATVVCRQLGYRAGYAKYPPYFGHGNHSMAVYLDDLNCKGTEAVLAECDRKGLWGKHNCDHLEDAGVECFLEKSEEHETPRVFGYPAVHRLYLDNWESGILIPNPHQQLPWQRGIITSWHFRVLSTEPVNLALQIWRHVTNTQYSLVSQTYFQNISPGLHGYYLREQERIHFKAGDVIGIMFERFNPIPYDVQNTCNYGERALIMEGASVGKGVTEGGLYNFKEKEVTISACRMYSLFIEYRGYVLTGNYEFSYGQSEYTVITGKAETQGGARKSCSRLGPNSQLVRIDSEDEFIMINGALNTMGLDPDSEIWIDGRIHGPRNFTRWAECEPVSGRECIVLRKDYRSDTYSQDIYLMYARHCRERHAFICENTSTEVHVSVRRSEKQADNRIQSDNFISLLSYGNSNIPTRGPIEALAIKLDKKRRVGIISGASVCGSVALFILVLIISIFTRRYRSRRHHQRTRSESTVRFVHLDEKGPI